MRPVTTVVLVVVLVIVVGLSVFGHPGKAPTSPTACTMEAKLCPGGTYVSRTGPNCEFAACPAAATSTGTSQGAAASDLAIGQQGTIKGVSITVLELLEDSRCPVDVQCIQAGTVRIRAAINALNRDFTFTLDTPQIVGNSTITLTGVVPTQKYSKQPVKPSDYRFTFVVEPMRATTPGQICTQDVLLCPDGSYVSRSEPGCRFAPCPSGAQ